MWDRKELKEKAKISLKWNYWKVVLVTFIAGLIGSGSSVSTTSSEDSAGANAMTGLGFGSGDILIIMAIFLMAIFVIVIAVLLGIFIYNPLEVGARRFFLKNLQQPAEAKEIAFAFDNNWKEIGKIMFARDIYLFGWSLLFIIPGIVKSYEYKMIPYLLAENPNLSEGEVFAISKQMMNGQKWNAFVLDLSFVGWDILSGFTLGLLSIFYVSPYKHLTAAALYEELSIMHGRPAMGQPDMGMYE